MTNPGQGLMEKKIKHFDFIYPPGPNLGKCVLRQAEWSLAKCETFKIYK